MSPMRNSSTSLERLADAVDAHADIGADDHERSV